MKEKLKEQRLLFMAIFFGILTQFPFLSVSNIPVLKANIFPALLTHIFIVWGLLIAGIILIVYRNRKKGINEDSVQSPNTSNNSSN